MELSLYWIDAFADRIFAGNPAAVVPLTSWPADTLMQQIARENGVSETSFFVRTGPARAHLRWFTPSVEVDLCGHATLAAAHAIFHELGQPGEVIVFDSKSGPLTVTRRGDLLELDFPSLPAEPAEAPADLLRGLGTNPVSVARSRRAWLCVLDSAEAVVALRPDAAALARLVPGRIIVTAPGRDCDFVSRFFAPDAGILEDPVTGSSHCTLAPYWAARLGRDELHARQVSSRGGELWCSLKGDRVRIAGRSAVYLRGRLALTFPS